MRHSHHEHLRFNLGKVNTYILNILEKVFLEIIKEMYKGEIKVDQLTIVQSCGTPPVF